MSMQNELMTKSLSYRNYLGAKKFMDIEANKKWGQEEAPILPKYEKPEIVKDRAGWINFFLSLRP